MGTVKLRDYQPDDTPKLHAMIRDVWGEEIGAKALDNWQWEFFDNPSNPKQGPKFYILDSEGEIAGMTAFIAAHFKIGDKTVPGYWVGHVMTQRGHRGHGLRLIRQLFRDADLLAGYPNAATLSLYERLGPALMVAATVNRRALLRPGDVFRAKRPGSLSMVAGYILNMISMVGMLPILWRDALLSRGPVRTSPINRFAPETDAFWDRVSPGYQNLRVRDTAYLNWRFVDCPTHNYDCFVAHRGDRMVGYLVCRTTIEKGLRRVYIVDFLVAMGDARTLLLLLAEARHTARQARCAAMSCHLPRAMTFHHRVLRQAGFWFVRPGRTMIVNWRNTPDLPDAGKDVTRPWFTTLGDSDIDLG